MYFPTIVSLWKQYSLGISEADKALSFYTQLRYPQLQSIPSFTCKVQDIYFMFENLDNANETTNCLQGRNKCLIHLCMISSLGASAWMDKYRFIYVYIDK
jgi:hypothetical protein